MMSQFPRILVIGVASLVMAACGGGGGGGHKQPPVPTSITIVSGNSQTGVAGSALPSALGVSVKDSSGRAVLGASVSWAVVAGGGSVTPATSTTDSAGLAMTNWTLGVALGANRLTATSGTLPAVAFDATGVAGPAATVSIVSGNGQSGSIGTELPAALTVRVTDSGTRPVSGVTVSWAVTAGGGRVTPTTGTTDSSGTASARWTLGTAPGANRATATVAGTSVVVFEATATATAAVTASVAVTSPTLSPYEGETVQLTAIAKDAYGNVLSGKTATWSSSKPQLAPVSPTGLLQTWGTGPVDITASVDGVKGSVTLTLTPILVTVSLGAKEVVMDGTTERCEDLDVADGPARFVRAEDGSLVLFSGNAPRYYVSRGAGFGKFARDCGRSALVSADLRTADTYENWEWVWSVYREGSSWHALVHNEFHDAVAATCQPGNPAPGNPCWYNSATYAVSTDGGRTFTKPLAPAHVVAPAPNVWVPPVSTPPIGQYVVEGYFSPSNIVRASDGYYYSFMMAIPTQQWNAMHGLCIFRTNTLGDPTSWRAWDGAGFNLRMASPYVTGQAAPICASLGGFVIPSHLVYNTYLERYMAVAPGPGPLDVNGRATCGFFYALSADLIHWSEHRLLVEASLGWCAADPSQPGVLEPVIVAYPSIVDHADTTVNFENAGRTPYFYYVRINGDNLDRDVVRVPLTLTRTN